ncbi:unnamed protein product [Microthlaspi erraticum]|uniref:Uncharacterized protein n=1 Tax=Microthlaspi erraticum TaxID=1685480 RepID=A0A6D2KW97_9BRAS|nr:unnamed protein product [Microthlaspi erraticum]CAA7061206.1 unnamed protein product [Microthlaspi erraticum]
MKKILQPNRLIRELQALMQEEDMLNIVLHHLVGVMDSFCKRREQRHKQEARSAETNQEQFKSAIAEAARPFLMARTHRFVEAYDSIYQQRLGWSNSRRGIGAANEAREEEENIRTRVTPYLFYLRKTQTDAHTHHLVGMLDKFFHGLVELQLRVSFQLTAENQHLCKLLDVGAAKYFPKNFPYTFVFQRSSISFSIKLLQRSLAFLAWLTRSANSLEKYEIEIEIELTIEDFSMENSLLEDLPERPEKAKAGISHT